MGYNRIINGVLTPMTEEEITEFLAEQSLLQQEVNTYVQKRVEAYPPIPEQLDMIFHNGIDYWKEQIQLIKDTYPKPDLENQ